MCHRTTLVTLVVLATLPGLPAGAAEPDAAAMVNACAACHGPDGRSTGAIPSIAGLPAEEFVTKMRGFRAGHGAATVMGRIAKGLSDAQIEALAAYLAERQP